MALHPVIRAAPVPVVGPGLSRSRVGRISFLPGGDGASGLEAGLTAASDGRLWPLLAQVPLSAVPLYAALALMHQGEPVPVSGSAGTRCATLVTALRSLGLEAEPIMATVSLYRALGLSEIGSIGTGTPTADQYEASTHTIVWVQSCVRMVDPGIAHTPLAARAHAPAPPGFPFVVELMHRTSLLCGDPIAQQRAQVVYSWVPSSQVPVPLPDPLARSAAEAGLGLAKQVLQQLRFVAGVRPLQPLLREQPALQALLLGETHLHSAS